MPRFLFSCFFLSAALGVLGAFFPASAKAFILSAITERLSPLTPMPASNASALTSLGILPFLLSLNLSSRALSTLAVSASVSTSAWASKAACSSGGGVTTTSGSATGSPYRPSVVASPSLVTVGDLWAAASPRSRLMVFSASRVSMSASSSALPFCFALSPPTAEPTPLMPPPSIPPATPASMYSAIASSLSRERPAC